MHSQWDDQEHQLQLHLAERQQQLLLQHREQLLTLQQRLEKKQAPMLPSETLQQLRKMVSIRLVNGAATDSAMTECCAAWAEAPYTSLSVPAAPMYSLCKTTTAMQHAHACAKLAHPLPFVLGSWSQQLLGNLSRPPRLTVPLPAAAKAVGETEELQRGPGAPAHH